jgi:hypothetical protein
MEVTEVKQKFDAEVLVIVFIKQHMFKEVKLGDTVWCVYHVTLIEELKNACEILVGSLEHGTPLKTSGSRRSTILKWKTKRIFGMKLETGLNYKNLKGSERYA